MRLRRSAAKSDGSSKRAASSVSRQSLTDGASAEEYATTRSSDTSRGSKFKIVFLGNSGVGKTWLVERVLARQRPLGPPYSNHHGNPNNAQPVLEELSPSGAGVGAGGGSEGTIGVTVNLTRLRLPESRTVLLQLWDTSGQEKYQNLVRSYLPGTQCIVLVYDPASGLQASRQALQRWHAFAKEAAAGATAGVTAAAPQDALVAVVAITRRRENSDGGSGSAEIEAGAGAAAATAAGVNFGRVFASSLCGCFVHQCGRRGGLLTPRWLADQLIRREQARSEAVARLFDVQQHGQQQQRLIHNYSQQHHWQDASVSGDGDRHSNTAASEEDDSVGCFWCHRLLCCRALKSDK